MQQSDKGSLMSGDTVVCSFQSGHSVYVYITVSYDYNYLHVTHHTLLQSQLFTNTRLMYDMDMWKTIVQSSDQGMFDLGLEAYACLRGVCA